MKLLNQDTIIRTVIITLGISVISYVFATDKTVPSSFLDYFFRNNNWNGSI